MAVVLVLFGSWVILRTIGLLGVTALATWHDTARYALAAMFVFTGVTHFTPIKHDMARMIPSVFPRKMLIVYITGVLEISGAAGLLIPRFCSLAGICLILLLIGMFCANVNAALKGVTLRGKPPTALWSRTPMQILFVGLIWWSALR
jgi:uncharacterized membrane protein